ncbi:hypothetical protein ABB37_04947 [Leptomonas pyrrhocoris]|uniref:PDZ domain-containing protein n=1 Tax=Leptomonas pyrrhocoris TaxID=157538 RepID=A0A0N0VF07_LEPPY|nr:hypothetical protein ABB37_04947 [Leptomonas pyrrhocoris]KPA79874.1 hypothetical protein ABB37_04947 [Leptomonas pyrrhocoris]|eukprot:XP_015658313.1 hypothetical protein ABB37_04947 [Leptomonas pyrrhocoris]
MTTVLNRKFDLLCHSGTCPSYLVDVLSFLVAHANDTELFKSELRSSDGGGASGFETTQAGLLPSSRANSAIRPDRASREASERYAADRRTQLLYRQVEDSEALDDALRASHESVLIAAEQSLQTYAEDLKNMNEIAMATSAKQLRAMRVETQEQMEAFRDRVCASVVTQTRDELDVMRSEFGASIKEDVGDMVRQLHEVSLTAQRQVQALAKSFAEFVAQTHEATAVVPLQDAHDALAAVEYVQERMDCVEAAVASRADVDTLQKRLQEVERLVATLGSAMNGVLQAAVSPPAAAATPCEHAMTSVAAAPPLTPPPPIKPSVRGHETPSALANSLPLDNAPKASAAPPSRTQASAMPVDSNSAREVQAATPSPPLPPPSASIAIPKTGAERLGVAVEGAEEGVVLAKVLPDSTASNHQLGTGHIISHVGRVAVTTPAAFEAALQSSEGQPLKLTTYDPFQGRIRVLTIQSF